MIRKSLGLCFFFLTLLVGEAQVNLQTGSAVFSLPVFNWQDTKSRLNLAITLNYDSKNGLKVDEIASNIGQGWSLNAGGVITRIQVGQRDDQMPGVDQSYGDTSAYPPGYLYNHNITNGCPIALTELPLFLKQGVVYTDGNAEDADRELDYFLFDFNGRTGMMVLGNIIGGVGNPASIIGDSRLIATYDIDASEANANHSRTSISSFHITDENGLIYTFRNKEYVKILRTHFGIEITDQNGPIFQLIPDPNPLDGEIYDQFGYDNFRNEENPYVSDSWYLSSITDQLTGRTVNFSYQTENLSNYSGKTIEAVVPGIVSPFTNKLIEKGDLPLNGYVNLLHKISITKTPRLSQITYPDGNTVTFEYGASRVDLAGDLVLSDIQVKYLGDVVNRFDFRQAYFIGNKIRNPQATSEYKLARLCLQSVQKFGAYQKDEDPPYIFSYYTGTNNTENLVPPPFSDLKDIWGYYNGDGSGVALASSTLHRSFFEYQTLSFADLNNNDASYVPPSRVKANYAKLGLLQTIQFPTGGTLSYEYDQNVYSLGSTNIPYGGVHVSQTILHDGSSTANSDIVTGYSYLLDDNITSSLWGFEPTINRTQNWISYRPFGDEKYGGLLSGIQSSSDINKTNLLTKLVALSVSGVLEYEAYVNFVADPAGYMIALALQELFFPPATGADLTLIKTYYNYDLTQKNLLPVQFKQVKVTPLTPVNSIPLAYASQNGWTIYKFSSDTENPVLVSTTANQADFSSKQRVLPWLYGRLELINVYNASGNLVKQTENDFDWEDAVAKRVINQPSFTCSVNSYQYLPTQTWWNASSQPQPSGYYRTTPSTHITFTSNQTIPSIVVDNYSIFTGHAPLTDTYVRTFNSSGSFQQTHTSFQYGPNLLPSQTITTLSNGDQQVTQAYYSDDYSPTGVFQSLQSLNLVDLPVATYKSIIKNGSTDMLYLGAQVIQYGNLANGDIEPSQIYVGRSSAPVSFGGFDGGNPLNYPNLVLTQTLRYDLSGNLVKTEDEGGRVTASLYDYADRYVVAKLINEDIDVNPVAYTSFETSSMGGWQLSGNPVYNNSLAVTGNNSLDMQGGQTLSVNFTFNSPYTLSFWSTGSISVDGASLTKSGPAIGSFTYYEYSVPSTQSGLTLTAPIEMFVDEVRLYPAAAQMTTFTYNPLLGKTSECDNNNLVSYFQYDNMGRILVVMDAYGNITKSFEYNFKR
ncbi:MAG TPA: hypothetical protein VKR32_05030 [Puia sp.]|nr:hypothetical protein [Puia sp.]